MFSGIDPEKFQSLLSNMQEKAQEATANLEAKIIEIKSGGGLVKITANAKGDIVDLAIDDELLQDKDSLQILLISAISDLIKSIEENKTQLAQNAISNLGGLFNK